MSKTVAIINSALVRKSGLESQIKEIRQNVNKLKEGLVRNPEETSSVNLSGGNYIFVSNVDIVDFALNILQKHQSELDRINLKIEAIGLY